MTVASDLTPEQLKAVTDNWTTDELGLSVIWNKPPYRDETTGHLSLLLPGENPAVFEDRETWDKRMIEYYLLVARDSV